MSESESQSSAFPARRLIWILGLVLVLAVVVTATRHKTHPRGAKTPATAATLFVGAANSGSGDGAAAISCTGFAEQARSLARSGTDSGISFTLGAISTTGSTASAVLAEKIDVGGATQQQQYTLTLVRTSGLWLVCGRH